MQLYEWQIKDTNGNTITIVSPSKTQARKQYSSMFALAGTTRLVSVEQGRKVEPPLPKDLFSKEKRGARVPIHLKDRSIPGPRVPIHLKDRSIPGPNDPCCCKSGLKYKKCCGR